MRTKWLNTLVLIALVLSLTPFAATQSPVVAAAPASRDVPPELHALFADDAGDSDAPEMSHRLIVELQSPPLATWSRTLPALMTVGGKLDVTSPTSQMYISRLEAEQTSFQAAMRAALPQVKASTYINEFGAAEVASYQIAFNGLTVDPGTMDPVVAQRALERLPGVKRVYRDYAYTTNLYTSTHLINAPQLWMQLDGQGTAGAGVKIASMDGGVHHAAPMFSGDGYAYPEGFPATGLGFAANNNGKIIASRVYFRAWDPPAAGEENPWPGMSGTPHGVHTASTAGGNLVTDATYIGAQLPPMSGVAPGAWIMSYRVFYNSVTNRASFYTAEGLAALEDIVADGADIVNNSWGGGPGSIGGEFDALDMALINASKAGVFVAMSNGNAGPGLGTGDHASSDYINVAASTTSGTYYAGVFAVVAPEPISEALQDIPFASAAFGAPLPLATVITHTYLAAANVNLANVMGCDPWPPGTFVGHAAVIRRGGCEFGVKVLNAELGGAEFAVIYNNAGDDLISMGPGAVGDQATISSIFIGQSRGLEVVAKQTEAMGAGQDAVLEINTWAFQGGNTPDIIASFSSRGPSVAMTLKPDIAAPGVNIMAQGYAPGTSGEDRHLGYGQVSGTSMAAPHVAGAAALLRSIHPGWSNAYIKSALMSTAKYLEVYNHDGSPAQPLDMGAGRLDLTHAAAPGVILDPPSLSFGVVPTGTIKSIHVHLTSVAEGAQTYELSTLYTGDGFDDLQPALGVTVVPTSVYLLPGASAMITVTFDSTASRGIGDNQGFIVMDASVHHAHMPLWARVVLAPADADVLIIGSDFSFLLGYRSYLSYYTDALEDLGMTYDFWNADMRYGRPQTVPTAAEMMAYKAIILFTGDHWQPNGTYSVSTPFTQLDMNALTEYANSGGTIIAMGQDLAGTMGSDNLSGGSFFYGSVLGGSWLQDSVTAYGAPDRRIVPHTKAPAAMSWLDVDIGVSSLTSVALAGYNEVPPVATTTSGEFSYGYNPRTNALRYFVEIVAGDTVSITAAHLHNASAGMNGPVVAPIFPFTDTQVVTDSLSWNGSVVFTPEMLDLYLAGNLYVNVHSVANPGGEVRAQLVPHVLGDGANNQWYVDEIASSPGMSPDDPDELTYKPLLIYPGPHNEEAGVVAMAHREQPTLERPGISYLGRSIYTTFGLEGVNTTDTTSRSELLGSFFDWAADTPEVSINAVAQDNASALSVFQAQFTSNITGTYATSFRWDFGDGSAYTNAYPNPDVGHTYQRCGLYTVRVEAVDSWGNHAIGSAEINVDHCVEWVLYLPLIMQSAATP
jgi:subtilisin family serine protease